MSYTEEKYSKFNAIRRENNLKSVWSIYEVDDIFASAGVPPEMRYMRYGRGNGYPSLADVPLVPIPSDPTYFDLWLAAEALIRMAGETHVYIEAFDRLPNDDTYYLITGS
jgi:hypothetical protein